jgi:hypothetical protein
MYMKKIWKKNVKQKKTRKKPIIQLTIIQCKQRYTLQCCRSGFKIIFTTFKASKFSIIQDLILLCDNTYDSR